MKILIILFLLSMGACNAPQKTSAALGANNGKSLQDSIPSCIKKLIANTKNAPVTNPPSKIYSYSYKGKTVYYVPAVCCDNFSDLYNESCEIIAHPDGGFTGRGDGKLPDFQSTKTNEKLLWADSRK